MALDRNVMSWFRHFSCITATCLLFLLLHASTVLGQVDQGSFFGNVQDPTGAFVPNAKVTLLNKDVGLSLETTTNSSGERHAIATKAAI